MIEASLTHAESAWLIQLGPVGLALAALLGLSLLLRTRLLQLARHMLERRIGRRRGSAVEPALTWSPPVVQAGQLLAVALSSALLVALVASLLAGPWIGLALAIPAALLLIWLQILLLEQRYCSRLERSLPAAAARLAAQLRSGNGIQPALAAVLSDMQPGPLAAEWGYLVERLGVPLSGGIRATPAMVVAALRAQSPSLRQRALLEHIEIALGQTHDVLVKRLDAAALALHSAEQRRSAALTELAQMRYSGLAIGLAALLMFIYLLFAQTERVVAAYRSPLGLPVGLVIGTALLAPILGGFWLSRIEELD